VLAVVASVASTFALQQLTDPPAHVERLTVVNDTVYDLQVVASRASDGSIVALGSVGKGSTVGLDELLDQGDLWVFAFRAQGRAGGTIQASRNDLEGSGWRITAGDQVARTLDAGGAPPSP
jgi:hypothetical protein